MNMKVGNIHIIDNPKDLPLKDFSLGDQFMLLEDVYIDGMDKYTTRIGNYILENKFFDVLYTFDHLTVEPSIGVQWNENDEPHIEYVGLEKYDKSKLKNILRMPNDMILPLNFDSNYHESGYKLDNSEDVLGNVHIEIFKNHDNRYETYNEYYLKNKQYFVYSKPLNKDTSLVLELIFNIDFNFSKFRVYKNVYLVNRDKNVISLTCNLDDVFKFIKHNYPNTFDEMNKFSEVLGCVGYDIPEYLSDCGKKLNDIKKMLTRNIKSGDTFSTYNDRLIFTNKLDEMFKPIFVDESINFKAYNYLYREDVYCTHNNKIVPYFYKKIDDINIEKNIRISKALSRFIYDGRYGINPNDGLFYINGQPDPTNINTIYKDDGGVIFEVKNSYNKQQYWTKINGYYVHLDYHYDREEINELTSRKELMEKMSKKQN